MPTTAQRCNNVECERCDRHWPIFDDETGVQVDDAKTEKEARGKADRVL